MRLLTCKGRGGSQSEAYSQPTPDVLILRILLEIDRIYIYNTFMALIRAILSEYSCQNIQQSVRYLGDCSPIE